MELKPKPPTRKEIEDIFEATGEANWSKFQAYFSSMGGVWSRCIRGSGLYGYFWDTNPPLAVYPHGFDYIIDPEVNGGDIYRYENSKHIDTLAETLKLYLGVEQKILE